MHMFACVVNDDWRVAKRTRLFLIRDELHGNTIHERAHARVHCIGVCSVLLSIGLFISTYLATVQLRERRNKSTCMSSLLQFMLRVDRQTDRHVVNVYDV